MRLAVVGWGGDSGVGRELISAVRNLPVECGFILENKAKGTRKDLLRDIPCFFSRPENRVRQMELFIEAHRPDTVLTWEVPGDWGFPGVWKANRITWFHVVHWDWFDGSKQAAWRQARLIAPNRMCRMLLREHYNLDSFMLAVPIDTERFRFKERQRADRFLSVYGYGGAHNRRSIPEILEAWRSMSSPPLLTVKAQCFPPECDKGPIPSSVKIHVLNTPEPEDLYEGFDVAIQPSRYEGVGVSLLEAQACGVPVIAVDAPPMNEIAPDLRIPVDETVRISIMGKALQSYIPSSAGMARVVSGLNGSDIRKLSRQARGRVERHFAWKSLRGRWLNTLEKR